MDPTLVPEQNKTAREIATISIYPQQGKSHSSAAHLSALAAYTRSLLQALPIHDKQRHLVLTNLKSDETAMFLDGYLEVHECWRKGTWRFALDIIRTIRKYPEIKVIHLQHEFNQFGGAATIPFIPLMLWILRLIYKKKILITFHEVLGSEMLTPELIKKFCIPVPSRPARILFKMYYKFTSAAAHTVIVQHQRFVDRLHNEMNIESRTRILPIGTETDVTLAPREDSRKKYGYTNDQQVLLFFGTLDWRKGLDLLLEAFSRLPEHYRLVIGGGQPVRIKHRPEYQSWYQGIETGIKRDKRITHIGFVDDEDIPELFAACDLVLLPYVVPQMVSAVLNYAASYERPFIASSAFDGHASLLALFPINADGLHNKIRWSFDGHLESLKKYSQQYKSENSWTGSASLLSSYYKEVQT